MNQLNLFEDNVSYMLPYMKDEFPMNPEVAKFLASKPTWPEIMEIQYWMEDNLPPPETEPDHYFSDGLYMRSLKVKGGDMAIGKRHSKGHVTILAYGDLTIITEHGIERVKGPKVWVDGPGVKRFVYAHADSLVTTIHGTQSQSLEELEKELTIPEVRTLLQGDIA